MDEIVIITGKAMMAYGQATITEDLYAARAAAGGQIIDEVGNVRLHERTGAPWPSHHDELARKCRIGHSSISNVTPCASGSCVPKLTVLVARRI
jgi:hypothetical protein